MCRMSTPALILLAPSSSSAVRPSAAGCTSPRPRPGLARTTRDHSGPTRRSLPAQLLDPMHTAFEVALIAAVVVAWGHPDVRAPLLVALACHVVMRVWSLVDFVPEAAAFEKADPAVIERAVAVRWTRRSLLRLPAGRDHVRRPAHRPGAPHERKPFARRASGRPAPGRSRHSDATVLFHSALAPRSVCIPPTTRPSACWIASAR